MEAVRSRAVVQQEKDKQRPADRVRKTKQSGSGSSHAVATGIAKGNAVSGSSSARRQQSSQTSPAQRYQESVSPAAPETSRRYWLSQIAKETERDEAKGQDLYGLYEEAVADPSSPLYSVYDAPTSSNPKYNAQTEKAMTEWQNLQGELAYWAQNDRNYSDDEIIGRINWKNYPTLAKMNATKDGGQTVYLTQPIGYNEDAMYGVLWAARNPDIATDDMTINAGLSAGGYGKQYQRDSQKAARLDPSNPGYNPYLVGSTMDDEMRLYGVNGFDADWLENNLQYRGTDEYAKVYAAEQKTKKAESELESLKSTLESGLRSGLTYDEAMPADFDSSGDYSTLRAMQEGIAKGSPIALTRAVAYDPEGMRKAYDQAYTRLYGAEPDSQYTGRVASATGAYTDYGDTQEMVDSAAARQQRKYTSAVLESGTAEEQASVSATGKASYGTTTAKLQQDIAQGTAGKEGAAASRQRTVSQQTATGYLNAVAARSAQPDYSEGLTRILDKAGVAPDSEDYTAKVAQSLAQQAAEGDQEAEQLLNEWNTSGIEEYWEKADIAETNQASADEVAAIEAQWKEAYGDDTPEYRAHKNTMDYIAGFQAAPRVDGSVYGLIGQAQQEGADTAVYTSAALKNNQAQLATLDQAIEDAQDWGAPDAYIENMQAAREQLLSQGRLIASYRLKDNEDYADGVAAFDQAEMNTDVARMNNADDEVIAAVKAPEAVNQYIHSPMQNPQALIRTNPDLFYAMEMTDDERSNFKYLYAAQGREEALAYYADLRGNLEERYAVAETEAANELGQKLPVTASLVSVATSPLQAEGVVYTLLQMLKGEEADPNAPAFSANRMISSSRQGVKDRFAEAVGDNELAKKVFAFFYDAMMSSGDSLVSAGIGGVTRFQNAGLALMSAEAASNAMQEARMKGADTKTAVWAGIASGAAEAVTEKIPFDRLTELYEAGSAGGKVFKAIMDEIIGEGVGEGLSEYLGAAGDFMVMGDESEFAENVRQYQDEMGMTQEEAARAAFADLTKQALYAALAGTVSGGMSSAGAYLGGKIASRGKKADTQSQDTRQNTSPETQQATQQQEAAQPVENTQPAAEPVQAESQRDTQSQNALNVLYTAQQNGVGTVQQTASVDAAMRSWGVEPATATATAKAVTESGTLGKVTRIMEAAQDKGKAAQAISMAMLSPDSESAAVLADMPAKVTSEDVVGLTQMYELDMKDAAAASAMDNAVERSQLADETVNALGQVDTGRVDAAQEAANKAAQQAREAQTDLADANARFTAADDALTQARTARQQNLNQETIAAESQALDQWAKARDARQKAARQYQTNMQALADATGKLRAAQQEGVNQARTVALEQQAMRQEQKAAAREQAALDSMSYKDRFARELDAWDGQSKGKEFTVGHTSDVLLSLGVPDADINLLSDKVAKIKKDHPAMTDAVIKQIPDIVENPVVVMKSLTVPDRLTMFGEVMDANGAPVLAIIDTSMKANTKTGRVDVDIIRLNSAYGKDTHAQEFIDRSEILYVDKNRADDWSRSTRLYLPIGEDTIGSANSIPQDAGTVNTSIPDSAGNIPGSATTAQNGQNTAPAANAQENGQAGGSRAETSQKGAQRQNAAVSARTVKTNSETGVASGSKVKSPVDTAKTLAKELHVGQDIGSRKVPKGVLGYYDTQAKYLAVRSTEAGNISTTMHELGHAIADKIGMTGTAEMVANLDPVFNQSYSQEALPGEAFAEFMWRYMTDDTAAQEFAGDAYLHDFEQALRKNGLDKQVHQARDEMHAYVNATVNQRIGAVVKNRSEKPSSSLRDIRVKLTDMLVDSTAVLEDINNVIREQTGGNDVAMGENLRNTAIMGNTASRRAYNMLTGELTDSNWQIIGDGLATRFERAGITGKDFDLLNNYMLALHSLDRDAAGKPVFDSSMTTEQRQAFIQDVQQNNPAVAKAEQEFQQFRNEFMQAFLVDTGYMSQATLDLFNKMYPHYVPTFRMKDGKGSGSGVSGKTFSIKRAKGSTENIYNPMDSFVQMVDSVVNMVSQNNTALVWDDVYHRYEGLGLYGREVTQDIQADSVDTTGLQKKIQKILEGADTDTDVMQQVLSAIGPEQTQWKGTGDVNLPNVLTVQKPDGSKAYYEIFDPELYKAMSGYKETAGKVWQLIGKATKAMSALTTGSNPVFAIRNFARDFQQSVTYGSWASNYGTGVLKWVRSAWDVWREKGEYADYKALGGGGWNRIESNSKKGADAYRSDLFKGYDTSNAGRTAKWAGKKVWNAITFARLNEVVEQTSRYAEYRYGTQDKSTAQGKQQAFLNAQEATVDFSRSGYSNIASDLKQVIPFLGASSQGIYQTGREYLTKAERSRLPARFTKTVVNTALASVLANLLVLKHTDDEDKEEYRYLSEELKADNFFIPNFAPFIFGDAPYLRIPLGQNPLTRAVHGFVSNVIWSGQGDDLMISLEAIGKNILDGFNPVNGTIFDAANSLSTNRNWYGSKIIPDRMEGWDPSTQYTEETPDIFVTMGRVLNVSPMALQYLAEQYTGFLGQMAIPAISKDKYTGQMGGFKAMIAAARRRLTSDPLKSNGITSSFYDGVSMLQEVTYAAKNDRPMNMLRRGLTEDELRAAVDEAKELTSSKGALGQAKQYLSDGYAQIDEIEARTDLTDHEKYVLTSRVRRDMMENTLAAQELIGEYRAKYIDGENPLMRLFEGGYGRESTSFEKLPKGYQADYEAGETYMQRAYDAWEASGKDSALPHASYSFSDRKVQYEVPEADRERFDTLYQITYQEYVDSACSAERWERMSAEEKLEVMQKAHEKGQNAAKQWWLKKQKK
jgi:hypothetical protein